MKCKENAGIFSSSCDLLGVGASTYSQLLIPSLIGPQALMVETFVMYRKVAEISTISVYYEVYKFVFSVA